MSKGMYDKIMRDCVVCGCKSTEHREINVTPEMVDKLTFLKKQPKIKLEDGVMPFCSDCVPEEYRQRKIPDNIYNPEDDKDF